MFRRSFATDQENRVQSELYDRGGCVSVGVQTSILRPVEVGIEMVCKRMMVVRLIRRIGLVIIMGMRVMRMGGRHFMCLLVVITVVAVGYELAQIERW